MGFFFSSCRDAENVSEQQETSQTKQRQPRQLTQNEKSVIELKNVRDALLSKQEQLEKQAETADNLTKELIKNKKEQRAKHMLQKKKLYEKYLQNVLDKSQVIGKMILEVQQASIDKDIGEVMTNANDFLKDIQNGLQDKLEDALLDMAENEQKQQNMDNLFEQYGVNQDQEEEYNKLEAELFGQQVEENAVKPDINPQIIQKEQKMEVEQPAQQPQKQQQKMEEELDGMLA